MIVTTGVTAVLCLWTMWVVASRGDLIDTAIGIAMPMLFLGALWLGLAIAGIAAYRTFVLSVILPGILVVTMVALWVGLPTKVGWELTKPALDRAANECTYSQTTHKVGLYEIDYVRTIPDGCRLSLVSSLTGPDGFARFGSGSPSAEASKDMRFEHIVGGWYSYEYIHDYSHN